MRSSTSWWPPSGRRAGRRMLTRWRWSGWRRPPRSWRPSGGSRRAGRSFCPASPSRSPPARCKPDSTPENYSKTRIYGQRFCPSIPKEGWCHFGPTKVIHLDLTKSTKWQIYLSMSGIPLYECCMYEWSLLQEATHPCKSETVYSVCQHVSQKRRVAV